MLCDLGRDIQSVPSYVTDNKIYCVYRVPNEELIRKHAETVGFPANSIAQVRTTIDPTTAEWAKCACHQIKVGKCGKSMREFDSAKW